MRNILEQALDKVAEQDTKKEIEKALFKEVLGAIMRTEYEPLTGTEVVRVAMGAIGSFAKREQVRLEWIIKD